MPGKWLISTSLLLSDFLETITLEQVRAVLADKSHDSFTDDVRVLLEKHGAKKLSEISPANYAALLSDAEKLK